MNKTQPPALRPQHNGWTPDRQQRFLDHLAATANVTAAAKAVGMSKQSAYWLRRQPHSGKFARAWDDALVDRDRWIEDLAMDRVLNGEEEVIERDGQTVAVRRRPCDPRILLFYLKRLERRSLQAESRIRYESSDVSKLRAELRALAALPEDASEADIDRVFDAVSGEH
jgi:hypothetical protein